MSRYQIDTFMRLGQWDHTDTYDEYWCEAWDTTTGETVYTTTRRKYDDGKAEVRKLAAAWVRSFGGDA